MSGVVISPKASHQKGREAFLYSYGGNGVVYWKGIDLTAV